MSNEPKFPPDEYVSESDNIKVPKQIMGNIMLAYICNDLQNAQNYKVEGNNCYYKDKFIGEVAEKIENDAINIYFKPVLPVKSINVSITIENDKIKNC
jgi:hypothetical protein